MLKKINDALPGLILGILIYGAVLYFAGIWFVADRIHFTVGLAVGLGIACTSAVHMALGLRAAAGTAVGEEGRNRVAAQSVLRYVLVAGVLWVVVKWNIGSLTAVFLGIFGLKLSAYLQPAAGKLLDGGRRRKKSEKQEGTDGEQ